MRRSYLKTFGKVSSYLKSFERIGKNSNELTAVHLENSRPRSTARTQLPQRSQPSCLGSLQFDFMRSSLAFFPE